MLPDIVIVLVMAGLGGILWVGQAYRTLRFAQGQMAAAWADLTEALGNRREMVPYIVAAVPVNISNALDVLGNACDMAANVVGIRECAQAEARLSAAIARLFAQLDAEAKLETGEILHPLRDRLKDQEMKIGLLKDLYNRQAEAFNILLNRGAAKILVSFDVIRPAELF